MTDTVTFHAHGAIASSVLKGSSEMDMTYHPIGIIHSPFTSLEAMPIQDVYKRQVQRSGGAQLVATDARGARQLRQMGHVMAEDTLTRDDLRDVL